MKLQSHIAIAAITKKDPTKIPSRKIFHASDGWHRFEKIGTLVWHFIINRSAVPED